jgi:MFS family permease
MIRVRRRGRLLAISTFGGTVPAVLFAWWLLPGWLEGPEPAYDSIFFFTGICFVLAAFVVFGLREPRDRHRERASPVRQQLRGAWQILAENRDYRRLVIVGTLFSSSIMVFPHYQALARDRLDLVGANLMVWVVVQNLAMGFASLLAGPVADRFGNRFTLRVLVFAAAAIPVFAVALTHLETETGRALFPLVFMGIGLTPIGFRVLSNYVLELSPASEHPRYLSLAQLCTAAAFLASPLLGLLIDLTSFELVFLLEAVAMLVGGLLTFRLVEPRHGARGDGREATDADCP